MRMKVSLRVRDGGFTLIEVMVVIAIIAALIGAGSLMLGIAQRKRMITQTQGALNSLGAGLEMLRSNDQLGRYPPTQIGKLTFPGFDGSKFGGQPNATNIGIETIYVVFRLPGISVVPQGLDAETAIGNTDGDNALTPVGKLAKTDLFEYMDAWGNPLVYISASDYKDPSKVADYVLGNGTPVKVEPLKNEKTGEFVRPDSFQLMSIGPDAKPGTDDDLVFGVM
jgi:prepilin-type N-terminal cleavage/methylation domain-containing protein